MAEAAGDIFGPINAETGDVTQWSSTVIDTGMTFDAHADALANGSYGFRCLGNGSANDARGVMTFADKTTIYVRCYFKFDSTISIANNSTNYTFTLMDGATVLVALLLRNGSGGTAAFDRYRVLGQALATTEYSTAPAFSADAWHYCDIYWYAGTGANGGATVLIDGTEIFSELNNNLTAYACDTCIAGIYACVITSGKFIYIDDVKGNSTGPIGAYSEAGGAANYIPAIYHAFRMRN